jgi:hypothetical protein
VEGATRQERAEGRGLSVPDRQRPEAGRRVWSTWHGHAARPAQDRGGVGADGWAPATVPGSEFKMV